MIKKTTISCLLMMTFTTCSVKKFIPEDKHLLTDYKVTIKAPEKIKSKSELTGDIENLIIPQPNSSFLGTRIPIWAHYRHEVGKGGFINKWINEKWGEEPVYLSDVDLGKTEKLIANRLENRGFFESQINTVTKTKEKTAKLVFNVEVETPYKLASYQVDSVYLPIHERIKASMEETLLKPGNPFDLRDLKNERERIDAFLKNEGYYNFNANFLIFEADTNSYEDKRLDMFIRLKRDIPHKSIIPYTIRSIEIYPNYRLKHEDHSQDTTIIDNIAIIQHPVYFKPQLIPKYLLLEVNTRYNPTASKVTSKRLSSIGTYKFVNILHESPAKIDSTDTAAYLNTRIYLSPQTKRSLRVELQATAKSNNFAGPGLQLTYSNRNLFKGGDLLNATAHISYESQIMNGSASGLNSLQFGLKSDLIIPRLEPVRIISKYKYDVPKTKVSLGVEYLRRSRLYTLRTASCTYGYIWQATKYIHHSLNLISLNLVNLTNTTSEFKQILDENPFLASSFAQMFITGSTYNFTYTELNKHNIQNQFYLSANLDVAGNALSLIGSGTPEKGPETVLGMEFAQYAKLDADLRYNFLLGRSHRLVARLFAGYGMAYGNSEALPFAKQYFAGGPYSVRAFRIRSIGPGTYHPVEGDNRSFFDQSGDIRLEGNIEYRFPIISVLKGAVFVDAGNVWLREANEALPGGAFSAGFLRELGAGAGTGLRIDIQNFVIRGDFAFPFDKPDNRFNLYFKELVFNFAIGYPF